MPAETMELCQPIQITSDGQPTIVNCQNIPDYSCPKLKGSRLSPVLHWVLGSWSWSRPVWRARLSHLLCWRWVTELCVKSKTQPPSSLSPGAVWEWVRLSCHTLSLCVVQYISIQGRLSKSLLSLWPRLSHPSTESPCCVHFGGRVRLSKPTLSHSCCGSANPCWVGGWRSS